MRELVLPSSISTLVDKLHVVQLYWQGVPIQLPKFAVHKVIENPNFEKYVLHNEKKFALIRMGKYQIPLIDPFGAPILKSPKHAVVVNYNKANSFGLYAYPADSVDEYKEVSSSHHSVNKIVKDFV